MSEVIRLLDCGLQYISCTNYSDSVWEDGQIRENAEPPKRRVTKVSLYKEIQCNRKFLQLAPLVMSVGSPTGTGMSLICSQANSLLAFSSALCVCSLQWVHFEHSIEHKKSFLNGGQILSNSKAKGIINYCQILSGADCVSVTVWVFKM